MLRLIGLVVSIGLADSVNPTTIGPALYLATGERARRRVAAFTLAVFAVYLLGGAAIALGPGQLVLSAFPPRREATHILEIVAGATMIALAGFLWWRRGRLSQQEPPTANPDGRSSVILGAIITAIELPTAFPYFTAATAIVSSGFDTTRQLVLLVLFNVCFVLPLVAIVVLLAVAGDGATAILARDCKRTGRQSWQASRCSPASSWCCSESPASPLTAALADSSEIGCSCGTSSDRHCGHLRHRRRNRHEASHELATKAGACNPTASNLVDAEALADLRLGPGMVLKEHSLMARPLTAV